MFNSKLKAKIKSQELLLDKYRERIDALEEVERENKELKLKVRIMEMYVNDDEAIEELLAAKKKKFDVKAHAPIDSESYQRFIHRLQAASQGQMQSMGAAQGLGFGGLGELGQVSRADLIDPSKYYIY
ncbi:MAG: hypothetical protein ABJG42_24730 [Vibrio splendidus]